MLLIPLNVARAESDDGAGHPHTGWRGVAEDLLDLVSADDDGVVGVDVPLDEVAVTPFRAELSDDCFPEKCAFAFLEFIVVPG